MVRLDRLDYEKLKTLLAVPDPRVVEIAPRRVIQNDTATIIFWENGTKTVVKCSPDDAYNALAGFCIAVCKRLFGSTNALKRAYRQNLTVESRLSRCPYND